MHPGRLLSTTPRVVSAPCVLWVGPYGASASYCEYGVHLVHGGYSRLLAASTPRLVVTSVPCLFVSSSRRLLVSSSRRLFVPSSLRLFVSSSLPSSLRLRLLASSSPRV